MDITKAVETLSVLNANLQKQIDANNLAISILQNNFQAEFTSIETNRKITEEKVALVEELTSRANQAETKVVEQEQTIATLEAEKAELISK